MDQPESYTETLVELIRRAATDLPVETVDALEEGRAAEEEDGLASIALGTILNNIELARDSSAPICQDTGTPVAWIHHPVGVSTRALKNDFEAAVREATSRKYLRPNAVNTLTGANTGDGAGRGIPFLHFEEWDEPTVEVQMILKGGGCENVGAQYKLPESRLGAGRDLEGVRRVVLDAVVDAQGKGCSPGVLGVCIGGDRVSGYEESKKQLLRPLKDTNPIAELADLEDRLFNDGNGLGVGPMGFGGTTTLLGVKIGVLDRLPASYFVSISYMCWANRKAAVSIDEQGGVTWLS
jgi:fumarate hydratase class I